MRRLFAAFIAAFVMGLMLPSTAGAQAPMSAYCQVGEYSDFGQTVFEFQEYYDAYDRAAAAGFTPNVIIAESLTGLDSFDDDFDANAGTALSQFRADFVQTCLADGGSNELYIFVSDFDIAVEFFWGYNWYPVLGSNFVDPSFDLDDLFARVNDEIKANGYLEEGAVYALNFFADQATSNSGDSGNAVIPAPLTDTQTPPTTEPPTQAASQPDPDPEPDEPFDWTPVAWLVGVVGGTAAFVGAITAAAAGKARREREQREQEQRSALHAQVRSERVAISTERDGDGGLAKEIELVEARLRLLQDLVSDNDDDEAAALLKEAKAKLRATAQAYDNAGNGMNRTSTVTGWETLLTATKADLQAIRDGQTKLDECEAALDELDQLVEDVPASIETIVFTALTAPGAAVDTVAPWQPGVEADDHIPTQLRKAYADLARVRHVEGFKAEEAEADLKTLTENGMLAALDQYIERRQLVAAAELIDRILQEIQEVIDSIADLPEWPMRLERELSLVRQQLLPAAVAEVDQSMADEGDLVSSFLATDVGDVVENNEEALAILRDVQEMLRNAQELITMEVQGFRGAEQDIDNAKELIEQATKLAQTISARIAALNELRESVRTRQRAMGKTLEALRQFYSSESDDIDRADDTVGPRLVTLRAEHERLLLIADESKPLWTELNQVVTSLDVELQNLLRDAKQADEEIDALERQIDGLRNSVSVQLTDARVLVTRHPGDITDENSTLLTSTESAWGPIRSRGYGRRDRDQLRSMVEELTTFSERADRAASNVTSDRTRSVKRRKPAPVHVPTASRPRSQTRLGGSSSRQSAPTVSSFASTPRKRSKPASSPTRNRSNRPSVTRSRPKTKTRSRARTRSTSRPKTSSRRRSRSRR